MNRAPALLPGALLTAALFATGCAATVYQPLRSLQRPVMLDLNEANFEGLHVQVRCPVGPYFESGDATKACRKIQQVFTNQGAVIDPAGAIGPASAAKPDLVIDIDPRTVSAEPDRLNSFFCVLTLTLVPCVSDASFTEEITIRDGDGTLLISDSLVARFVTYNGVALWSVNAMLDAFARPVSERLTTEAQLEVFSHDFYGQLSQLAFHARTRLLVLRNFERAVKWLALLLLCSCASCASDPASTFASRKDSRNFECVRLGQAEAARLYPGVVPGPEVRGANLAITDALVCKRQLLEPGERSARDEAILSSLTRDVGELVKSASALEPAKDALWHVDAFYPDERVAAKIADAARTELAEHGRAVSDRVPILAAGDVAVIDGEPPRSAYPAACARYFAEASLVTPEVFLGLMIIDAREAELHAGVCARGQWRWLR